MTRAPDLDRVDELSIRLTYGRLLEGPAHDVFLLDVRPRLAKGRFDERPYLDCLEPVLRLHGGDWAPVVVHVNRTHRNWAEGAGEAEIVVSLATGRSTTMERAAVDTIGSAFRQVLGRADDRDDDRTAATALDHEHALLEARLRTERGYVDVPADRLTVSDEEHGPASGMWSVGLVLGSRARFNVRIGFVDGDPRATHIRRMPGSEIVDSLGTGGDG